MAESSKKKPQKPEKHWIARKDIVRLLNISGQAFDKWNVQPIAKIGRNTFYELQTVMANRMDRQAEKLKAIYEPEIESEGSDLNPVVEKARLDKAKRIGQELNNDKQQGDVFPIEVAGYLFAKMGSEVAAILGSLPAKLKRLMPKMTATQVDAMKKEIAKAQNTSAEIGDKFDEFIEEYYT